MKKIIAPNGQYFVNFINVGDLRFGPMYFEIELQGSSLKGRFFGDCAVWSPNSRYLALQEWLTLEMEASPITALVVIDMIEKKECQLSKLVDGWIIPRTFENSKIVYQKHSSGLIEEYEIELNRINRWHQIK